MFFLSSFCHEWRSKSFRATLLFYKLLYTLPQNSPNSIICRIDVHSIVRRTDGRTEIDLRWTITHPNWYKLNCDVQSTRGVCKSTFVISVCNFGGHNQETIWQKQNKKKLKLVTRLWHKILFLFTESEFVSLNIHPISTTKINQVTNFANKI